MADTTEIYTGPSLFSGSGDETETIRASITRVVYHEKGYCIAKIQMDPTHPSYKDSEGNRRRIDSIKGNMIEPMVGQLYDFSGIVAWNDQYKTKEMRVESYRTILPTDRDGIASYLINVAKWVGPSHARAILDAFGDETLTVLKDSPDRVTALNIPNLTADRVAEMSASLAANADLEAATIECNNMLGGALGPATVKKAIKKFGKEAPAIIKQNPFVLTALHGVGFKSADAVAKKLGTEPQDMRRHQAALYHILAEASQQAGHTFLRPEQIELEGRRLMGGLRPDVLDTCVADESAECDGCCVSLGSMAKAEKYIALKLSSMIQSDRIYRDPADGGSLSLFPRIDTDGLAPDQVAAVDAFTLSRVFVLCGAPGTGKTYTVARIVKAILAHGLRVAMAAPTGKAAKQMNVAMQPVTGGQVVASTIHSMLGPTIDEETGEFRFERDESNPLDADLVIIDEFSMVDVPLCRSLLRAIPQTSRLLIVGDHYQLPSVGPGAVLRDLIAAGVPSWELKEIKRNAGTVVKACHAIKDGRCPTADDRLDIERPDPANWRHVAMGDADEIKGAMRRLITDKIRPMGIDPVWGMQIISPVNEKGPLSCDALNALAKGLLNDIPCEEKLEFSVNDKVVRTKNGYAMGYVNDEVAQLMREAGRDPIEDKIRIVNGDLGVVSAIDAKTITVHLMYPPRVVRIPRREHCLKLAYCMTCHKLQGSECDVVVMPLHQSLSRMPMVNREWIYTAFSRAKRFLVTIGDFESIAPMVRKVGNSARQTMLKALLEREMNRTAAEARAAIAQEFDDL